MADQTRLTPIQQADLSSLADGSLDPARRPDVQAWIDSSAELQAIYARERAVVERLQRVGATERAPDRLRARVEAGRPPQRRRDSPRPRLVIPGFAGAALVAVIVVLALVLPGGTPGAPSVSEAAALALRGPNAPRPGVDSTNPAVLTANVQGLAFPTYAALGYHVTGERLDVLRGRRVVTVYYRGHGATVAYSIVAAPPLDTPSPSSWSRAAAPNYYTQKAGGRTIVTWWAQNHTCVLSASGVSSDKLTALAKAETATA